jgi:cysteinyl-tRNA synthetase
MNSLVLYDTAHKKKRLFEPRVSGQVHMYVCGPTVYDRAHLGNARSCVVFDLLYRVLRSMFDKVVYVRNITDIDDKIIQAASAGGESCEALTDRTLGYFFEDMDALSVLRPTHSPKATEHISGMIQLIELLLEKGVAYVAEEHVMFHVKHYPGYGSLSRTPLEAQRDGARVEVAPYKKAPEDFVLWKPSPRDSFTPGWESPWGWGRPGWHLECSVMSHVFLDLPLDIHGGGQDLLFPHHENEKAQSCCGFDQEILARFWVHNGFLLFDEKKMSKSLGNVATVHDLRDHWSGETIRWALLSAHYRQPLNWTEGVLANAQDNLDRLYGVLREVSWEAGQMNVSKGLLPAVAEALADDLNTPLAFQALLHAAHDFFKAEEEEKQPFGRAICETAHFLGFLNMKADAWFQRRYIESSGDLKDEDIESYLEERTQARQSRNFARADEIRDLLEARGIIIEDSPQGVRWRRR